MKVGILVLKTVTGLNTGQKILPAYRFCEGWLIAEELPVVITRERITYVVDPDGDEREIKEQETIPAAHRRVIQEFFNTVNAEGFTSVWTAEEMNVRYLSYKKCGSREHYVLLIDTAAGAVAEIQAAMESETQRRVQEIQRNMSQAAAGTQSANSRPFSAEARQLLRALREITKGDWYLNIMIQDFLGEIAGPEEYRLSTSIIIKRPAGVTADYDIGQIEANLSIPVHARPEKANLRLGEGIDTADFVWVSEQPFTVTAQHGTTLHFDGQGFSNLQEPVILEAGRVRICDGY